MRWAPRRAAPTEVGWTLDGKQAGFTSVEVRTEPAAALTVRVGDQETLIDGTGEIHTRLPGAAAGRGVEVWLRADGDAARLERVTVALAISRPS